MLENSVFTVASPEAAASILWRDSSQAAQAAASMRITAVDLVEMGIVDSIIPEPPGGAHSDHAAAAVFVQSALRSALRELSALSPEELIRTRHEKYRRIGAVSA